jgi:hypothetical protein
MFQNASAILLDYTKTTISFLCLVLRLGIPLSFFERLARRTIDCSVVAMIAILMMTVADVDSNSAVVSMTTLDVSLRQRFCSYHYSLLRQCRVARRRCHLEHQL